MRRASILFVVLLWGWIAIQSAYGNRSIAVDWLSIAIVAGAVIASFWTFEKLWPHGPEKKLRTGLLVLLVTVVFLTALWRYSLASDTTAIPITMAAFLYSIVVGGTPLSLTLLGSGCYQALQRRRYYRSLDRSSGS